MMKLIIARWIKKKRKNYTNIWAEFEKKLTNGEKIMSDANMNVL